MPGTTITINSEQRDGLYELVRNHIGSVGDLFDALEREKDFAKPQRTRRWRTWRSTRDPGEMLRRAGMQLGGQTGFEPARLSC